MLPILFKLFICFIINLQQGYIYLYIIYSKFILFFYARTQKDKERGLKSIDNVGVVFQRYEATKVSACWYLL